MPFLKRRALASVLALTALGACSAGSDGQGGVRASLGLDAPPPDPFLTVSRAPLRMPPDMRDLPPPRLGAPSLVEPDAQQEAISALSTAAAPAAAPVAAAEAATPAPVPTPATQDVASRAPSAGEAALLGAAGAAQADPAIRQTLRDEARPTQRRFGLDSFLGRPIVQDPEVEAKRLDPRAETERLQREGLTAPTPPPAPVE